MMFKYMSFFVWLGKIIAFLGVLAICMWLMLRPKTPTYSILFISAEQSSNQNENGTIIYRLEIENSNMDSSVYYRSIAMSFLYGQNHDKVADTTIGSFHQGIRSKHNECGTVNAKSGLLKNLLTNAISNATAELKVALMTRFRYKTWGIKSKFHGVNLEGNLPIGADGKLKFPGKKKKYKLKQSSKTFTRSVKHKKKYKLK